MASKQRPNGATLIRNEAGKKLCIGCDKWLDPLVDFSKNGRTRDKLNVVCRACDHVTNKRWREETKANLSPKEHAIFGRLSTSKGKGYAAWGYTSPLEAAKDLAANHFGDVCGCCGKTLKWDVQGNHPDAFNFARIVPGGAYNKINVPMSVCSYCNHNMGNASAREHRQIADFLEKHDGRPDNDF